MERNGKGLGGGGRGGVEQFKDVCLSFWQFPGVDWFLHYLGMMGYLQIVWGRWGETRGWPDVPVSAFRMHVQDRLYFQHVMCLVGEGGGVGGCLNIQIFS